jgi:hypothetical protein
MTDLIVVSVIVGLVAGLIGWLSGRYPLMVEIEKMSARIKSLEDDKENRLKPTRFRQRTVDLTGERKGASSSVARLRAVKYRIPGPKR